MPSPHVFDITAANVQTELMARSQQTPVLLDFWAEWCGPCKTFAPVLEKLADAYGGAFVVGKVDTEAEQQLAYAFQVQSIPFCVLIRDGRPIDAFQGALPENDVRRFLEKNGIEPAGEQEDEDSESPKACLARAKAAARLGEFDTANEEIGKIPAEEDEAAAAGFLAEGLGFLVDDLPKEGAAVTPLATARTALQAGDLEPGLQAVMAAVEADAVVAGPWARKALMLSQALWDDQEDVLQSYRRRLATLLY